MIGFLGGGGGGKRNGLGRGFGGLVRYLEEGPKGKELEGERLGWWSSRNMDSPASLTEASVVLRATANQNVRTEKPVYHFGVSLARGESLGREEWERVADRFLKRLGLEEHQAVVALHSDRAHEHIHLVVNRVHPGELRSWEPRNDVRSLVAECRALEKELGLRVLAHYKESRGLSRGEYQEAARTGIAPAVDRLRTIGPALRSASGWGELEGRLAVEGFRLDPARRGSGVVVWDGRRRLSLSHVHRELSGPRLAKRFGETVREYQERVPERPAPAREDAPEREPKTVEERSSEMVQALSGQKATWTRSDVHRATFHDPDGAELLQEALDSGQAERVGVDERGEERFASREYLEAERRLWASARSLDTSRAHRLSAELVGRRLETSTLSEEQQWAVLHATSGSDLALVVGRAGVGKTRLTQELGAIYRDSGYRVLGAAPTGKAAEGLSNEAGFQARTMHSWLGAWEKGRDRLGGKDVLVVDEAGMVDGRLMSRFLSEVDRAGAKAVLLGDPEQLKAIAAGDAFRGLLERHGAAHVETIRRQTEDWQREAAEALAGGDVAAALEAYDSRGFVEVAETKEGAHERMVTEYFRDLEENPDGSRLLLSYRRADVGALNEAIRDRLLASGAVAEEGVEIAGGVFSEGDRIVFLRNAREVKNGTLGTVVTASTSWMKVRLEDGREVGFDPAQYTDVAHAYAMTVHKSQGVTVDRTWLVVDPLLDRHAIYVALTRHRENLRVIFPADQVASPAELSRARAKDLAGDYENPEQQVRDVEERLAFHRSERDELAYGGNTQVLASRLGEIHPESRLSELAGIYARPAAAEAEIRGALERDREAAWARLEASPETYGDLRGGVFRGGQRKEAIAGARKLGRWGGEQERLRKELRSALLRARGLDQREGFLRRTLGRARGLVGKGIERGRGFWKGLNLER